MRHFTEHLSSLQYALAWSFVRLYGVNTAKDTFANGVRMYTSLRRKYVRHLISESKYRAEIQIKKNPTRTYTHTRYVRLNVTQTGRIGTSLTPQRNDLKAARLIRERENLVYRNWETMSNATRPFYLFLLFCCFLRRSFPPRSQRYAPSLLFRRTTRRECLRAPRRHKLHAALLRDEKIQLQRFLTLDRV